MLVVGDYVSSVEIPWISEGGSLEAYRATLARLGPLVEAAEHVVPGHGPAHAAEQALRLIEEDIAYLDALEAGEERPPLPDGRDSKAQRKIHSRNMAALAAEGV